MKLIKLMTVTALATGTVFGGFVESAEALVRTARTGSSRGIDAESITSLFTLFDTGRDGQSIVDMNPNDDIGFFSGAVENYVDYSSILESGVNLEDIFGIDDGDFGATDPISDIVDFEDTNDLINQINTKLEQDGTILDELVRIDLVDLKAEKNDGNSITYSFLISGTEDVLESFNFVTDNSNISQSINMLPQIIENFSSRVISEDGSGVVRAEVGSRVVPEKTFNQEIPDPQAVPESRGINSLLGFGILGLGVALQRKLQ